MDFLKKKAKYFEEEAREAYEKSRFTLVLFFCRTIHPALFEIFNI
jgi:hypothetical protein